MQRQSHSGDPIDFPRICFIAIIVECEVAIIQDRVGTHWMGNWIRSDFFNRSYMNHYGWNVGEMDSNQKRNFAKELADE